MRPADNNNIENILKNVVVETNPELDRDILENLKNELDSCQNKATGKLNNWSKIMNNKFTKIAAAAVILIALSIFLTFSNGGSSIALADAIKPLLNAKNAVMEIILGEGENQTVINDTIMGQKIFREVRGIQGARMVIDLNEMKLMTISPQEKTVTYVKLDGLGNIQNYLVHMQNLMQKLLDSDYFEVEDIGYKTENNIEYYVYKATVKDRPQYAITIWIEPATSMPVKVIEQNANTTITCDNIKFNVDIDESVFSMEVPDGYTEQKTAIDFSANTEENFIEMLRLTSEIMNDGFFPDSVGLEDMVKFAQTRMEKAFKDKKLSNEQQVEIATKWGQGLVFIRMYKGQGQWYYNGKGVKLGEAETPVFWWHPQNSDNWHVIYGDLTVEECSEQDLPEVFNN